MMFNLESIEEELYTLTNFFADRLKVFEVFNNKMKLVYYICIIDFVKKILNRVREKSNEGYLSAK